MTLAPAPNLVHNSCRLCEYSDAKLVNPVFVEISSVLSDQKSADRKNSLSASPFSAQTRVFTQSA